MTKASNGQQVEIHYTGTLEDGTTFDSSSGRDPLSFKMGERQIIPGLEKHIEGMEVGEKKQIKVEAAEAYGPHHPEQVQAVPRSAMPEELQVEVGMMLQAEQPDGQRVQLTVVEVGEAEVKLDANHPLAGKDLTFDVEIVAIS